MNFDLTDPFQRQQAHAHSAETAALADLFEDAIEQEIENQLSNGDLALPEDLKAAQDAQDEAEKELSDLRDELRQAESERDDATHAHGADLVRIMCFLEDALAQKGTEFRKRIMRIRDAVDICSQDDVSFDQTIADMLKDDQP